MTQDKATKIELLKFNTPPMRAFHMTWMAFFLAFFGWFGIAPLMAVVREELSLTKAMVGNIIIASVAITILVRLIIGPLCDRFGPRRTYSALLVLGSLPVMGIGFANSYESFLIYRLAIGAIGASFVITQYHTSVMFAPNCVGTANATTAGWGNLGGGVTQMVMPLIFAGFMAFGFSQSASWRLAMVVPGVALFLMGLAYLLFTHDAPDGSRRGRDEAGSVKIKGATRQSFIAAARDYRVWALFLVYAGCFGVELTMNNIAAIYFHDKFELSLKTAGLIAGLFGLMNLFARSLGGIFSDRVARLGGLKARVTFLGVTLFCEGLALLLFSQMGVLVISIVTMVIFSLFVQMAEGATYAVVPFVNKKALGAVAGIVGAGGNAGAVAAGFLFRAESLTTNQGLMLLGLGVLVAAAASQLVRFKSHEHADERADFEAAVGVRAGGGMTEAVEPASA